MVQTYVAPFLKADWFMLVTVLELIYDRPVVLHLSFMIYDVNNVAPVVRIWIHVNVEYHIRF